MRRALLLLSTVVLLGSTLACGNSGERSLPASPVAPGDTNSANITAPVPSSPGDDQQIDGLRPTLTVTNATSSGSGARSYEFQISDGSTFASTASALVASQAATVGLTGIPEGADGRTSFTPQVDLLPASRYYWRARAIQGSSIGPWSSTARFRTQVASFKSGNRAFDILTEGTTIADENNNVSILPEGAKLNSEESYLSYRMTPLAEGEVSFIGWRVKPIEAGILFTMQDGTGDFNSNPYRVRLEKRPSGEGGKLVFQVGANTVETGSIGWLDNHYYYFKIEWRGGTARVRVYNGTNEAGGAFIDLSTSYSAPYGAAAPVVTMGSRFGGAYNDVRVSRLYIGPTARPVE